VDPEAVAERARRIQEAVATTTAEVTSDDYAVTVVVGPGGAVLDLRLSSRAFRYDGAELGAVVVRTIREANVRLAAELSAVLAGESAPAGLWTEGDR
jgi:DNA-binding protein YbaB